MLSVEKFARNNVTISTQRVKVEEASLQPKEAGNLPYKTWLPLGYYAMSRSGLIKMVVPEYLETLL